MRASDPGVFASIAAVSAARFKYSRLQAALLIGGCLSHLGCSDPGGEAQPATGGASGAVSPAPSESGANSQSGAATAPVPSSGGASGLNWNLAPFSGGGSAGSGIGGAPLGGAVGTGGSPSVEPVQATCPLLCDCIVDICANLRLFEHGICLNQTQCDTLTEAQRSCRINECLQSQGDADPLKRCQHAIGQGEGAPAACQ